MQTIGLGQMRCRILRRHGGGLLGVAVLEIAASLALVAAGYSFSFLFEAYEQTANRRETFLAAFAVVAGIFLAASMLDDLKRLAEAKMQQIIKNELRAEVAAKITALDHADFCAKDCGNYVSWLTDDVDRLYVQSFATLFSGLNYLATTVFAFGALLLFSGWIGLAAALMLAVSAVCPRLTEKWLQRENEARSAAMERGTEAYKDAVMGGTVFLLANRQGQMRKRICRASQTVEQAELRFNCANALIGGTLGAVSLANQLGLWGITFLLVIAGIAPAGAVLAVGNLTGSFFGGARQLMQAAVTFRAARPLWEKFEASASGAVPACAEPKKRLTDIPTIELRDVSFGYGAHGEPVVLDHQSFTFCAGGKYAIVGQSGCGKSTLTKLLLGLLPGYTGEVRYGGCEQRQADLKSLYEQVAYVDQQVYLFQDTVRFNITLGQPYTEEQIWAVLRKCRLAEYVRSLPHGLDTVLAENGKNLSGGQRQRIALARGLIRKVQYLILDEGTSALDADNARRIEDGLLAEEGLGVIFITHHLREEVRSRLNAVYTLGAA
jgi:ABC-type multidrug transport system fused ATPase/permease subunit